MQMFMTLPERFRAKIIQAPSGCWIWIAAKDPLGYGRYRTSAPTRAERKTVFAHRVAYELLVGPIPDGLILDHLCRRVACCNPAHLDATTQKENVRRGNRHQMLMSDTHCAHGHPWTEANTYVGPKQKSCRLCSNDAARRYRARQREAA